MDIIREYVDVLVFGIGFDMVERLGLLDLVR